MKLVQTLVVRDEADIVSAQIDYHLKAGVDFVLATDHESRDGTTEILASYERQGVLRLFREQGEMRESVWRSRMARLAATEHGADWVINTDADEFWMPRRGTLKEALAAVPREFGVVWAITRHFLPRPGNMESFSERMTVRLSATAPLNDPTSPYRPHAKAAHRADPEIVVLFGSHDVVTTLVPLRGWYPADVLHFPFRSREQYERKGVRRARGDKPLGQYVKAFEASERGRVEDFFGSLTVDDETLAAGRRSGSLAVDTRLRDALRGGDADLGSNGSTTEEARAAVEGVALTEANIVRTCRRLDVLAARIRSVEERSSAR
ncbi:MAG: glycosyltransferase family 2 protein [Gaiellaceae bacterium]